MAERVKRLPPYLFGKINDLKYRKRRAGLDIIDLGMGNPTDVPDDSVIDKLCEAVRDERNHRYSISNGLFNLRREFALRYSRIHGVSLDPDTEVLAGLGSKEVFSHMCLALIGPGDTAIVPAPSFPIHVYAVAPGLRQRHQPRLHRSRSFSVQRIANGRAALSPAQSPHPQLPAQSDDHGRGARILRRRGKTGPALRAHGHQRLCLRRRLLRRLPRPSFLSVPGAKEVGVETTTMSKGYNMAGWRIGFCAGNPAMVRALATIKGYYDYGLFQAVQIAAILALRSGDEQVLKQCAIYQQRRDVLVDGLERIGWTVAKPKATMFVWAQYPKEWRDKLGSIDFSMKLLEEAEVAVSPGRGFGECGEGFLRLALVENEHRLRQAVRQIGRCLRSEKTVG